MKEWKQGRQLALSKKEIQLLVFFFENPGQIFSREQILETVWDVDGLFGDDNTVPVNITWLRINCTVVQLLLTYVVFPKAEHDRAYWICGLAEHTKRSE